MFVMPSNERAGAARVVEPSQTSRGVVCGPTGSERPTALKVLLLEDEPNDAELIADALRKAGLNFTVKRVDTRADFVAALEILKPDVVLTAGNLPDFSGAAALAHVRRVQPEAPVIIITDSVGDEAAVELLKAGAQDSC
jgi:CheY-like chemotaxis protein